MKNGLTWSILVILMVFSSCAQESKSPNIIIIMADDMGYGDLSGFGSSSINTPNLDRMAQEGMKFTDFHSNGTVCSPTRAALLTGRYQQRFGIEGVITALNHRDVGLAIEEVTFADALKLEGYRTGIMGKWHLGYPERLNPVHQGFDEFIGYVSGNVDYYSHVDQEAYEDWWFQNNLKKEVGYTTDLITKHSINFIKKHKDEKFLLYIPHEAPHGPFQGRKSKAFRIIGDKESNKNPEKNVRAVHKEMIEIMDEGVGKILKTLKALKLDKNTLVFFCSDNGPNKLGSSGRFRGAKGSIWEGGHRVPGIAWWPGKIKSGQVCNQTVMTMDLFPTMVSLSGSTREYSFDGTDISQTLLENKTLAKRELFWRQGGSNRAAVRDGDWKLVRLQKETIPMLYNLKDDPSENIDVASKYPDRTEKLHFKLKDWEEKISRGVKRISP
ncbi:sulfatase-like hydrolase/transferase [Flagellimonas pacifica]|uniref:Arylsulfatase A n=1 Tax=Flagellimonas pacifica TaxID=1247520 RepID=A0A285MVD6_9FLAO|nr:sulfatase-like hydrolase/transferase [Allomuricauda parva]SNZ01159.1 Arylsulfatase A [Allomuricauda parva]